MGSYSSPGHADVRVDTHAYVHRSAFHGQRTFTRGKKSAISSISRVLSQNVCFQLTRKGSGKSACVPMWRGGGGGDFLWGGGRAVPSGATSHLFSPFKLTQLGAPTTKQITVGCSTSQFIFPASLFHPRAACTDQSAPIRAPSAPRSHPQNPRDVLTLKSSLVGAVFAGH